MTNKKFWEQLIAYFPWYDTGHIENDASKNSYIVACVFVTAVTFLLSRCLAMIWENTQTHTHTATWSHKPTLFFKIRKSRLKRGQRKKINEGMDIWRENEEDRDNGKMKDRKRKEEWEVKCERKDKGNGIWKGRRRIRERQKERDENEVQKGKAMKRIDKRTRNKER
jgi:hypothetical protein